MKPKNFYLAVLVAYVLLSATFASAHSDEDFLEAEKIISEKIPCSELNENQLEILGDYYMEQMHPGEAHEYMDEMMGGEGSESLRQIHINMGIRFYCNSNTNDNYGMMSRGGSNMMDMMYGNKNSNYSPSYVFNWVFGILVLTAIVLLIALLVRKSDKKSSRR